jgi:hypothetical protein
MADILAFVRNTPRTARTVSAASDRSEVIVFPGASVELMQGLWSEPEEELAAAATDGRTDH